MAAVESAFIVTKLSNCAVKIHYMPTKLSDEIEPWINKFTCSAKQFSSSKNH